MSRFVRRALSGVCLAVITSIGVAAVAAPVHAAPRSAPTRPTSNELYTVKPGDYLLLIATKLHVTLDDLLAANGLTKKSVIHPGDQLVVPPGGVLPGTPPPAPAPAPPPPTTGELYTVKPGDYFKRIAQQLGVTMDALVAVNNMKKTTVIHPGMQLQIPAGGVLPPDGSEESAKIKTVLDFASAQLGEPYKANGAGPNSWDCSGLTMRAYAAIGISLPHYSASQAKYGQVIDWTVVPIRPGDLVFLASNGTISHVGIATGPTTWIQSPQPGGVVRTGNIPFYRVFAVRRLVNGG